MGERHETIFREDADHRRAVFPHDRHADLFSMYVAGKGGYVSGNGPAFSELQVP